MDCIKNSHPQPLNSPARNATDVLAVTVHNLGYWPENSVVLVSCSARQVGPIVRVGTDDVLDVDGAEAEKALSRYLELLPAQIVPGEPIDRVFCIVFGHAGTQRTVQLTGRGHTPPSMAEVESEAEQAQRARVWIEVVRRAVDRTGLALADLYFVSQTCRWTAIEETNAYLFDGFVEDVLKSPVYLELLMNGSVVAGGEEEGRTLHAFNPQATTDEEHTQAWGEEAHMWFEHYDQTLATDGAAYAEDYLGQKFAETTLWSTALEVIEETLLRLPESETRELSHAQYADAVREAIPAPVAGFMAATLTSAGSSQFIVFATAASLEDAKHLMANVHRESGLLRTEGAGLMLPLSTAESGQLAECVRRLHSKEICFDEVSPDEAEAASELFGTLLTGRTTRAPEWNRVSLLDYTAAVLASVCHGLPAQRLMLMRSWIAWLKGSSSDASAQLEACEELLRVEPSPLQLILESAALPRWVGVSEHHWRHRSWNLEGR